MIQKRTLFILVLITLFSLSTSSWTRTFASDSEFTTQLEENTKKVWLVYRQQSSSSIFDDVSDVFRGMIQVAFVGGSDGDSSVTLLEDNRENPIKYNGQLTVENIVKFVLSNLDQVIKARSEVARALKANQEFQAKESARAQKEWDDEQNLRKKSDTLVLDAKNWNTFTNGRQAWVINFYEANCSACIELNKEWELISTAYKGKVKVAKINMSEPINEALEDQVQLSKYPSIRFYKSGPKKISEFGEFEGIHKRFSIQEWLNTKLEQKTTSVDIPSLNKENYETLCKSTKNTCIIVFLDNASQETLSKIQQLSVKHLKKPITFLLSEKGEQDAFAKQVQVSSYPETVMVYCKQKKLWKMGGLDLQAINDAIEEISMGNRNNFVKYTFSEPSLK